jgi:hypothetical protein
LTIASFAAVSVQAAPSRKAPSKKPAVTKPDPKKGYRKKELNFEERVIEGLSNRGYESLSQTGSNDGLKGEKLYRKRAEFDEDSKSLLREMEYLK